MTSTPDRFTRSWEISPVLGLDAPPAPGAGLRVAIVHDYLTQRGGAERVVLSLLEAFPNARLVTSVYNPETTFPELAAYDVETSWINKVGVFRKDPRRAMPFLPAIFSGIELDDVDVVICSSSGWSHGIRTKAPKIVYCHNPARWLYQRHQYVEEHGTLVRTMVKAMAPFLKAWDRKAAKTVDTYLANSRAVAGRIEREYGIQADILPPAITIDPDAEQHPVDGLEPGFLLTVSRARGYKNVEVVAEAIESMPGERLVVVGGLPEGEWSDRLTGAVGVTDAQLRWLYANCSAVVAASHEDFGLTPVEGYRFGKAAICLRAGGFLDTMAEGVSGVFIEDLTAEAVVAAVQEFRELDLDNAEILRHSEAFGFLAFRDKLVREAEFLLASRGLDPVVPTAVPRRDAGIQSA